MLEIRQHNLKLQPICLFRQTMQALFFRFFAHGCIPLFGVVSPNLNLNLIRLQRAD
jgi:hypothetical protein